MPVAAGREAPALVCAAAEETLKLEAEATRAEEKLLKLPVRLACELAPLLLPSSALRAIGHC